MTNRSRRYLKRLVLPVAAAMASLAFLVPAAGAIEQHHYGGVVLQPGKERQSSWAAAMLGNRAVGQGSQSTCQSIIRMWAGTESKTCGAGEAGNFLNNQAWWNDVSIASVRNNSGSAQRVDGYYWTLYNILSSNPIQGNATEFVGYLRAGESLESPNWGYSFRMQADGNAVVYRNATGQACWHTATNGNPGAYARMQTDGNFVIYSAGGTPLYNGLTSGNGSSYMEMQNDGNLVIYRLSDGKPTWATSWQTGQIGC